MSWRDGSEVHDIYLYLCSAKKMGYGEPYRAKEMKVGAFGDTPII